MFQAGSSDSLFKSVKEHILTELLEMHPFSTP